MKSDVQQYLHDWLAFNRIYERLATQNSLSFAELSVLLALEDHNYCATNRQLVLDTGLSKQTISSLVQKMARNGLMCLESNPVDRRSRLVKLTKRGQKWAEQVLYNIHQFETKTMNKLGEKKIRQLNSLNEELLKEMEEEVQK
ncbi:MarR family winged helix-turn-helix transcriptional regulator [Limosilactobacillus fastidiosus]|uniref:Winged helix-turn-helix transcriptional regulator n=1 Tax=Limosilactobacillus fastidiosus TaxID=2759855 RepID=A0A7W3YCH6_9LACO|nr:MarR family winged helix-turn-helix transcriptional regulator [Limosilactobacillus fastidiosus]MBB1062977.1 winged helix-turn-helix transcriptional regulator [Limosilactobacillus fastidiosus]MBB1086220.1 winged helix-turn-helix transcriptional regulator [Limosilactobacillus fastidiosus]MCD7084546.1 MarR family winged helix-turn-helix transcriptional regulator [Limosilactobacillus fastidiosus]MCD7086507.1 MarR family winged helix-turn-helix transcriptional regulator [Limosilactobacillus fasti